MKDPTEHGYAAFEHGGGYIALSGPYFWKRDGSGLFRYGFQSDARHGNPNGVLHGAAIIAFVDTFLGHAVVAATQRTCATIALNTQFVAGVPTGGWIEGGARLRKVTRTMAFLDGEASASGSLLLTASAIFRIFEER